MFANMFSNRSKDSSNSNGYAREFDNRLIDILNKPTPSNAELYRQVAETKERSKKVLEDSRFAKQLRERHRSTDIMSDLEMKRGAPFLYDEPAAFASGYEFDRNAKPYGVRTVYKTDKRPTELDIFEGYPKYENDFFDELAMEALEGNTGYTAVELVESGQLTPLSIQHLSDVIRERLVGQIERSDVDGIKEQIAEGRTEPEFNKGSMDVEIASEEMLYDDANSVVGGFLKGKGFFKDSSGYYYSDKKVKKSKS